MAIAFAAGPIAGQNFGAGRSARVRETLAKATLLNTVVMVAVTLFLQWRPELLVGVFTESADAREVGATFLRTISWTFIAQGVVFTCSGIFQGLGNTTPAMMSSAARLAVFVPLAIVFSRQPGFHLQKLWYLSVATVWFQACVSFALLRWQFNKRLSEAAPTSTAPAAGVAVATAEGPA